jgi:hypothetical protein
MVNNREERRENGWVDKEELFCSFQGSPVILKSSAASGC